MIDSERMLSYSRWNMRGRAYGMGVDNLRFSDEGDQHTMLYAFNLSHGVAPWGLGLEAVAG